MSQIYAIVVTLAMVLMFEVGFFLSLFECSLPQHSPLPMPFRSRCLRVPSACVVLCVCPSLPASLLLLLLLPLVVCSLPPCLRLSSRTSCALQLSLRVSLDLPLYAKLFRSLCALPSFLHSQRNYRAFDFNYDTLGIPLDVGALVLLSGECALCVPLGALCRLARSMCPRSSCSRVSVRSMLSFRHPALCSSPA